MCSKVRLLHTGREPHWHLIVCTYTSTHVPVVHLCAFLEHLMVISMVMLVCGPASTALQLWLE